MEIDERLMAVDRTIDFHVIFKSTIFHKIWRKPDMHASHCLHCVRLLFVVCSSQCLSWEDETCVTFSPLGLTSFSTSICDRKWYWWFFREKQFLYRYV